MAANTLTYCDFDNGFSANPITGDISVFYDVDVIKQSLENIIKTNFYERAFHPEIGTGILGSLFENMTPATQTVLQNNIQNACTNFEPRAKILSVVITPYIDDNALAITIVFQCMISPVTQTLSVLMDKVR